MKGLFDSWRGGWELLIDDELISWYSYFSIVLAEIAFLWGFLPDIAMPFTILLGASILNVIIMGFLKGAREGAKEEVVFTILYAIFFASIFIIGLFFNWIADIVLFAIALIFTAIWINIRDFFATIAYRFSKKKIFKKVNRKIARIIAEIFVIGLPLVLFVCFVALSPLPVLVKIILPLIYTLLIPVIVYMEDGFAACNIFELAYEITWSKEMEEWNKKIREIEKNKNKNK